VDSDDAAEILGLFVNRIVKTVTQRQLESNGLGRSTDATQFFDGATDFFAGFRRVLLGKQCHWFQTVGDLCPVIVNVVIVSATEPKRIAGLPYAGNVAGARRVQERQFHIVLIHDLQPIRRFEIPPAPVAIGRKSFLQVAIPRFAVKEGPAAFVIRRLQIGPE
jgi:hypothetical protein